MPSVAFNLAGETALITGGGTGIGLGIARCMARANGKVVLVGRRVAELKSACEEIGPLASYVVHDVTDFDRADFLVDTASARTGTAISILVNNAGIHLKKPAVETSVEEFRRVLDTHVFASHALTAACLPKMLENKHGNILFTASMTSLMGMPLVIAYSAAKSALLGMVRGLTTEVASEGVRVNAIAPGWIETAMTRAALDKDPARKQRVLTRTPMGRLGDIDDIGWAAVYLCSPAARFVTGVCLPVDGGASIGF